MEIIANHLKNLDSTEVTVNVINFYLFITWKYWRSQMSDIGEEEIKDFTNLIKENNSITTMSFSCNYVLEELYNFL